MSTMRAMATMKRRVVLDGVEVFEDVLHPIRAHLRYSLLDRGDDVDLKPGEGVYFRAGDLVKVQEEIMRVEAVNPSGYMPDRLEVHRGFGGTEITSHRANRIVEIVGVDLR